MSHAHATVLVRPYCSLADVQGITGNTEVGDDTERTLKAINTASRLVEDMTETHFWFRDHTSTPYRVPNNYVVGGTVFLPFPVITLTELAIASSVQDLSDMEFGDGERYIKATSAFGGVPFTDKMEIKGTFGYALADPLVDDYGDILPPAGLPEKVRRATMLTAAAVSGLWLRERVGLDGSKDTILETRIPNEVTGLLSRFKYKSRLVGF